MKQRGTASVVGSDGTVIYDSNPAIAAFPESIENEDSAMIDEFKDGFNELIGWSESDERERMTLILVAKQTAGTGSLQAAKSAMKFPPKGSLVKFTPDAKIETTNKEIFGDPAATPAAGSEFANVWIYQQGATRTMSRGRAALRIPCFKAKSSSLTAAQLVTVAT